MLTVRWVWGLGAFVVLGVLTGLVVNRCTLATVVCLLLVPPIAFLAPFALGQGARNLSTLRKRLNWWHAAWFLIVLSGLVFRVRDTQTIREAAIDVWAVYRMSLVGITAFALLLRLALRQTPWIGSLFRGLVGALAAYSLVCAASTLWSVYPAWTLYKSLEYLIDVALIAALLATVRSLDDYKTAFDWTWVLLGGLLLTVWVGAIIWPDKGFIPVNGLLPVRIAGVMPAIDQNTVADYAACLAIVGLSRLHFGTCKGTRIFNCLLLAFGLATLVLSQTRVTILGFLLGVLLVLFLSRRIGVLAIVLLTAIVILSIMYSDGLLWKLWERGESQFALGTLSGRLPAWELGWREFLERPLTGYGAYSGGRFVILEKTGEPFKGSMLNAYMEVMVGTGIWGLFPIVVALAGSWWLLIRSLQRFSFRTLERQLAVEASGILVVVTARSFFTCNLIWHPPVVFLVVLGYAELLRRRRKCEMPARR